MTYNIILKLFIIYNFESFINMNKKLYYSILVFTLISCTTDGIDDSYVVVREPGNISFSLSVTAGSGGSVSLLLVLIILDLKLQLLLLLIQAIYLILGQMAQQLIQ